MGGFWDGRGGLPRGRLERSFLGWKDAGGGVVRGWSVQHIFFWGPLVGPDMTTSSFSVRGVRGLDDSEKGDDVPG